MERARRGVSTATVIIPTLRGPVDVVSLAQEPPEIGFSMICINKTIAKSAIATDYDNFVKQPTGIVHRLFCTPPYPCFRFDISDKVETGQSWQLPVFAAHALAAAKGRLVFPPQTEADLVWATGAVSPVDFSVGAVGHVSEKLRRSFEIFEAALESGRRIHLFIPADNAPDVDPDVQARLDALGLDIRAIARVDDLLDALGLPPIPRAASRSASLPGWSGNPYRGLEPFLEQHRSIFFGRAKAREEALELLRTAHGRGRPFLVVHGRSGVGKSSFVRAGLAGDVIERAEEGGRFASATMTPSEGQGDPGRALVAALGRIAAAFGATSPADPASGRDAVPVLLDEIAGHDPAGDRRSGLLIIDQLEELFDPSISNEARLSFTEDLDRIVRSGRVWVIATLRSDMLGALDELPILSQLANGGRIHRLDRPTRQELGEIIAAPAALAGREFADRSLPEALADVAVASPDSLPLLQAVLFRLFDLSAAGGKLTAEGLGRLGGFEGAVGRWAEDAREDLIASGTPPRTIDQVLLALVRLDEDGSRAFARTVPARFEGEERRVLDALIARRLVSIGEGAEGGRARLAHEVLIEHWHHLADLVKRYADAIATRDDLERRTVDWVGRGEDASELLRGAARLETADALVSDGLVTLTAQARRFVAASLAAATAARDAERRTARRRVRIAAAVAIVFAAIAVYAGLQTRRAEDARTVAVAEASAKEVALDKERAARAAADAEAAAKERALEQESLARGEARAAADREAAARADVERHLVTAKNDVARLIALKAREVVGSQIDLVLAAILSALPDLPVERQHVETLGQLSRALNDDLNPIWTAMVRLDVDAASRLEVRADFDAGSRLIAAPSGRSIAIHDATTGAEITALDVGKDVRPVFAWAPSGERIATPATDAAIRLWNARTGDVVARLGRPEDGATESLHWNPRDDLLAVVAASKVHVHRTTGESAAAPWTPPIDDVMCLSWSPDGRLLALGTRSGAVSVWDVGRRSRITARTFTSTIDGLDPAVWALEWRPDGRALLVVTNAREQHVVDPSSAKTLVKLVDGNIIPIQQARWKADGAEILTLSPDGIGKIWDAKTGEMRLLLGRAQPARPLERWMDRLTSARLGWEPGGSTVATAWDDGTVHLWSTRDGRSTAVLHGHGSDILGTAWSRDGSRLVSIDAQGDMRIWTLAQSRLRTEFPRSLASPPSWSFDRTRLAIAGETAGRIEIVDVRQGKVLREIQLESRIFDFLAWSPDDRWLAALDMGGMISVFDAESGRKSVEFRVAENIEATDEGRLEIIGWSPDGRFLQTATWDGVARVWDARTGTLVSQSPTPGRKSGGAIDGGVSVAEVPRVRELMLGLDPEPKHAPDTASSSDEGQLPPRWSPDRSRALIRRKYAFGWAIWDPGRDGSPKPPISLEDSAAFDKLLWSPASRLIYGAEDGQGVRIWDGMTGRLLRTIAGAPAEDDESTDLPRGVYWAPDDRRVAILWSARRATVVEVDTGTRVELADLGDAGLETAIEDGLDLMTWMPGGDALIVMSADGGLRRWDARTGRPGIALTPSGSNSVIQEVDRAQGRAAVNTLVGLRNDERRANPALLDLATGVRLAELAGGEDHWVIGFGVDGTRLATTTSFESLWIWNIERLVSIEDLPTYAAMVAAIRLDKSTRARLYFEPLPPQQDKGPDALDACDRLASHPLDPRRVGPGVAFKDISTEAAITACTEAVARSPDEPRFVYQLGRARSAAGSESDALALFRKAADANYPMAYFSLGHALAAGPEQAKDDHGALRAFARAVELGVASAMGDAGFLIWRGRGVAADRASALKIWQAGAQAGDAGSHMRLGWVAELGRDGGEPDLERALFHYAVAVRLYEAAGLADISDTDGVRLRRANIARNLAPATVVSVAREAARWKPSGSAP